MADPSRWESLLTGFMNSLDCRPSAPALEVADRVVTYRALGGMAGRIAHALRIHDDSGKPIVGILAGGTVSTYSGILGILGASKAWLPIVPFNTPPRRAMEMLSVAQCDTLIAGIEDDRYLLDLLQYIDWPMIVIMPNRSLDLVVQHPSIEGF